MPSLWNRTFEFNYGALLLTVKASGVDVLLSKFKEAGIAAVEIGVIVVEEEKHIIYQKNDSGKIQPVELVRPIQDALWDIIKRE